MKTQLERARERHNALVEQCNKAMDRFNDAADVLVKRRVRAQAFIRAVVRSEKRLKKLREEAAKPKAPAPAELNDKLPKDLLPKELVAKPVAKSRKRRTPDDFAAEIKDRRGQAAVSEKQGDPFLG
jgi:hypothetical protein